MDQGPAELRDVRAVLPVDEPGGTRELEPGVMASLTNRANLYSVGPWNCRKITSRLTCTRPEVSIARGSRVLPAPRALHGVRGRSDIGAESVPDRLISENPWAFCVQAPSTGLSSRITTAHPVTGVGCTAQVRRPVQGWDGRHDLPPGNTGRRELRDLPERCLPRCQVLAGIADHGDSNDARRHRSAGPEICSALTTAGPEA
jgi:hypothetical protein